MDPFPTFEEARPSFHFLNLDSPDEQESIVQEVGENFESFDIQGVGNDWSVLEKIDLNLLPNPNDPPYHIKEGNYGCKANCDFSHVFIFLQLLEP